MNHIWQALCAKLGISAITENRAYIGASILCTTLAVVIAWVYFRSTDIDTANRLVLAMFGFGEAGVSMPYGNILINNGFGAFFSLLLAPPLAFLALVLLYPITLFAVLVLPNAGQLVNIIEHRGRLQWSPNWKWAATCAIMLCSSFVGMFGVSEFIYFQF